MNVKGKLLTFRCPGTSSDSSPDVCRIRFSMASLRCRLRSVMSRMTRKTEISKSAVHSTKVLRELMEMKANILFGSRKVQTECR